MIFSSPEAAASKARLRKLIKYQLADLQGRRDGFDAPQLVHFLQSRAGVWAAFQPIHPEPPILPLVRKASHLDWVFPRTQGETMTFHRAQSDQWKVGPLGILEPSAGTPQVEVSEIEGALIPALAYDRMGGRLGRGKGYYDRFLTAFHGLKVGVIWSQALVDEVPTEPHDVRVSWIATESEWIDATQEQRKG